MRHARAFGRGGSVFVVGAYVHALGLDANRYFAQHLAALDVHDGHERIVLVGDVDDLAGRIDRHQLGVGTRFELTGDLECLGVDHVHDVAVAGGNEQFLEIGAQNDAARPPRNLDRLDRLQRVAVEHGDRVILLVRDEDRRGRSRSRADKERDAEGNGEFSAIHVFYLWSGY